MDTFETITSRHVELLAQQQSPSPNFLEVVQKFREEIFSSGRDVLAPAERDQLRSILRFWTNYINQNSSEKIYETRDLEAFQGTYQPPVEDSAAPAPAAPAPAAARPTAGLKPKKAANWMWLVGLGLVAILAVVYVIAKNPQSYATPPPPTSTKGSPLLTAVAEGTQGAVNPTELASVPDDDKDDLSNTDEILFGTDPDNPDSDEDGLLDGEEVNRTKTDPLKKDTDGDGIGDYEDSNPGVQPTPTVQPSTATPRLSPTPTLEGVSITPVIPNTEGTAEVPTPEAAFNVELTSPANGEAISPQVTFRGTYTNIPAGWTIHLVFKPLSKGGLIFPWREAYTVKENEPSGNWEMAVNLGTMFDLSQSDEYVVDMVVAYSDDLRKALLSGADRGLKSIPADAFALNKPAVVKRQAYKVIDEERILFSAWLIDQQEQELFSARLDGSDITQITFTSDVNEDNPSLSFDGKQISFVDNNPKAGYSIWVMDSSGENRTLIYADLERTLEGPVFSADGRYLAFSASEPRNLSQRTTWNIYAVDLKAGPLGKVDPFVLTRNEDPAGNYLSNRWPFWLDEKSLIYSGFTLENELVYRIELDTRRPTLFYGKSEASKLWIFQMPVFFSATSSLAFHSSDLEAREIYGATWPDGDPVQLTSNRYRDDRPRFSADGKLIIYESNPKNSSEIWVMQTNGRDPHKVIGDDSFSAMWPYVGKMVAYIPIKP